MACIGLIANKEELTIKSLPICVDLVTSSPALRDSVSNEHFQMVVDLMSSRHKEIYPLAAKFVS